MLDQLEWKTIKPQLVRSFAYLVYIKAVSGLLVSRGENASTFSVVLAVVAVSYLDYWSSHSKDFRSGWKRVLVLAVGAAVLVPLVLLNFDADYREQTGSSNYGRTSPPEVFFHWLPFLLPIVLFALWRSWRGSRSNIS